MEDRARSEHERELIAACEAANADPETNQIIAEWEQINDPIEEPWDETAEL